MECAFLLTIKTRGPYKTIAPHADETYRNWFVDKINIVPVLSDSSGMYNYGDQHDNHLYFKIYHYIAALLYFLYLKLRCPTDKMFLKCV